MVRKRNSENKGLPARWRIRHGAFYYRVPPGLESLWDGKTEFFLGASLPDAYKAWSARMVTLDAAQTVGALLDRYALEVIPGKAPKTQTEQVRYIRSLKAVFGDRPLGSITPQMIYKYHDLRSAKRSAKLEIEVLSHAFSKAIKWGLLSQHPFKGQVRFDAGDNGPPLATTSNLLEDWELLELLAMPSHLRKGSTKMVQAYIRIKLLTGLRQRDLLLLQMSQIKDDGIHVLISKTKVSTGKQIIYNWSPELRAAIDTALSVRPALSSFLFCNRYGKGFVEADGTAGNWNNLWCNFVDRALKVTGIKARFSDHSLRKKVGSEAENLERARQLLGHADSKTTEQFYRLKPERVAPVR